MGLFDLFNRKKNKANTQIAKINHYFYAVIVTKKPYEIDKDSFIYFDEVKPNLYKDMDFLFFSISELRRYLAEKMLTNQYFDKIYFYSVCIQPLNEDSQDLTKEIFKNRFNSINTNIYKNKSLKISFIDDFTETMPVNLFPGIRTSEDLNECLSNLYTRTFERKLKPRVYDILKKEDENDNFDFSIIESTKKVLNEGTIIDIFYNHYPKDNWISSFTKELVDTMIIATLPNKKED